MTNRQIFCSTAILLLALSAGLAPAARAGTVTGTVRNGTTGKAAAGVDMILIQLQGGMQPVATTKTDAQGHYSFDNPTLGNCADADPRCLSGRELSRAGDAGASHGGCGSVRANGQSECFQRDRSRNRRAAAALRGLRLARNSTSRIRRSRRSRTFARTAHSSSRCPMARSLDNVSAAGSAGMPVIQSTIDKGKNKSAIAFPFRPGDNERANFVPAAVSGQSDEAPHCFALRGGSSRGFRAAHDAGFRRRICRRRPNTRI